ncbi:hypothetical protein OEG84_13415 [Hoeflea sp. G2-23]|uniref:Uncharacterized protein n=1 Tax=Hoeflea algicola TaxID=2983763 RepID=A0ABT3ZBP7_9HYPH|nr:hypothetical protein [Hoeflea algicola]MCY0148671.1 hypothetical protein [Hoeflea algicola]
MTTLWGLHMPEDIGSDALENGYVAIGWSAMGDISNLPKWSCPLKVVHQLG